MAEDYDVIEEDREEEAKLRKSKIILCKYTYYILILAFVMVLS